MFSLSAVIPLCKNSLEEKCLTSNIDFVEDKKEEEREKNKKKNDYDEAELILENMHYNTHSDKDFYKDKDLYEFVEFEDENDEPGKLIQEEHKKQTNINLTSS